MEKKQLVTVANVNGESNVFVVEQELGDDKVLLNHPLSVNAFVIKNLNELDLVQAVQKSAYERCLEYVVQNKDFFDFERKAEINCLCVSFVVNRKFTDRLRNLLVRLVGVPAKIQFNNSAKAAIEFINKNKALLDDYHNRVYHNKTYFPIFSGASRPEGGRQLETVFNLAGFLLAQLNTK